MIIQGGEIIHLKQIVHLAQLNCSSNVLVLSRFSFIVHTTGFRTFSVSWELVERSQNMTLMSLCPKPVDSHHWLFCI